MNSYYYRGLNNIIETDEFFYYVYYLVKNSFCSFNYHETTLSYISKKFITEIKLKYKIKEDS